MAGVSIKGYKLSTGNDRLKCFICGNKILDRYYFLSSVKCRTSGIKVTEILSQLIGELYCVVVSESDVICRCCTSLLNTYDRLESLKNQLCSIVRQNLNDNYLSKQAEERIDFEMNQDLFSVKSSIKSSSVNYSQPGSISTQSDPNTIKLEESKSIIQTAFEALQFDLNEFPACDGKKEPMNCAPSFSEQTNVTYSAIPSSSSFVESDIENQISALTDIDISYINDDLPLLPTCNLDKFQGSLLNKTDEMELLNLNSVDNSSMNHVILTDVKKNIRNEQIENKNHMMDEYCFSDDGEHIFEASTAENFYVQIVRESGETSRSVLTLNGGSAKVLKRNWDDVGLE